MTVKASLKAGSPQAGLECVILVEGRVPDLLLRGLPDLDSLRLPGETPLAQVMTMLVGVVSEYSELHELLSRIVGANLPIMSASAQPLRAA